MRHLRWAMCALLALGAGCADGPTAPPGDAAAAPRPVYKLACYDPEDPHCLSEPPAGDLDPEAPGIYLGTDFSFSNCTNEFVMSDGDADGLGDGCEYQLALAFRPLLMMSQTDPAPGRESYWAATVHGPTVVIVYMFGYYTDNGDPGCNYSHPDCFGHFGDNEFIVVYANYDAESRHWVMNQQFFSAHWRSDFDHSRWVFRDRLEYPAKYGTYSRVWVARSKHANYPTRDACNGGAFLNADDCPDNVSAGRFDVDRYRNVGSMERIYIDETASQLSPYSRPGREYFWRDIAFCGWNVLPGESRGGCAPTSYFDVLEAYLTSFAL